MCARSLSHRSTCPAVREARRPAELGYSWPPAANAVHERCNPEYALRAGISAVLTLRHRRRPAPAVNAGGCKRTRAPHAGRAWVRVKRSEACLRARVSVRSGAVVQA
jgi:hypothetical protein